MASPRSSLGRKGLKGNLGIRASRVSIRQHVPWYWYGGALLGAFLIGVLLTLSYQMLRTEKPREVELQELRQQLANGEAEISHLRTQLGTAPNELLIAQTAQQTLAEKLQKAEAEVASLKEDLAYCERVGKREAGIRRAPIQVPGAGTIPANTGTK